MFTALLLASPAIAMDVNVRVLPHHGDAVSLDFKEVVLGQERAAEVPCSEAPVCRITLRLDTESETAWRVNVKYEERRRHLFKAPSYELVANPTFITTTGQTAELFAGGEVPMAAGDGIVVVERGLHISAVVLVGEG